MFRQFGAMALGMALVVAGPVHADHAPKDAAHDHAHAHGHDHNHGDAKSVYDGYFDDSQIAARALSDWQGDWQSVYSYLIDGTLDPVMDHKAEHGDKSAQEYRDY